MFPNTSLFNNDQDPSPDAIVTQFEQNVLNQSPVIYGSSTGFNIQVFSMAGGGFYAKIYDGTTPIFQRRNSSGGTDTGITVSGSLTWLLDHFQTVSYDKFSKTLTLSGSVDTVGGIVITRTEKYQFISDYIIENTWTVTAGSSGASLSGTNWNYYLSAINAVWDIGNSNLGDNTSFNPLGLGVQFSVNGSIYAVTCDSSYGVKNNNEKRALASQSGIAVNWVLPGDSGIFTLTANVPFSLKQWFFKSTNTQYNFMEKATLSVARSKGYGGTLWDQICQVTSYINTSLQNNLTDPRVVPSSYYNGMWMRDSFWQSFLISDTIENSMMTQFEAVQQISGAFPTKINTDGVAGQVYHDESTMLYIIRAYYDYKKRARALNNTVLTNAINYIATQVSNFQWTQNSGSTQSWADTYIYASGDVEAYNQGMYCLALQCALLLGLSGVTQAMLTGALAAYQALYDSVNQYIRFTKNTAILSPLPLTPEALSIWMLSIPMLTDTQVNNHLTKLINVANTTYGYKLLSNVSDGSYLATGAFSPSQIQGDYQNGASWFLYDYLAFFAGLKHGFPNAQTYIDNRKAIEITVDPVSHEFLQTLGSLSTPGSEPTFRHVYSWNAASFVIR